jgi:integrase
MKGHVRSDETCPICKKPFLHKPGLGLICAEHLTRPEHYYADIHLEGERIRIYRDKFGDLLDSYDRADSLLDDINGELKHHTFDVTKYVRTKKREFEVSYLMDTFEAEKVKEAAPSYKCNVRRYCRIHRAHWQQTDVRDIRKIALKGYLTYLAEILPGDKSRANQFDHFKAFLNWCKEDAEILPFVPDFPVVDYSLPTIKAVSAETMMDLLEKHVPEPDFPIMAYLFTHPVRPGEARALKACKIDLEQHVCHIDATFSEEEYRPKRKSKKSPPVMTPIHPDMADWLKTRKEELKLDPDGFVFINPRTGNHYTLQNICDLWTRIRTSAGLPDNLRLYDCTRHSLATLMNRAGATPFDIKNALGHTRLSSTERSPSPDIARIGKQLASVITFKPKTVGGVSAEQKGKNVT